MKEIRAVTGMARTPQLEEEGNWPEIGLKIPLTHNTLFAILNPPKRDPHWCIVQGMIVTPIVPDEPPTPIGDCL